MLAADSAGVLQLGTKGLSCTVEADSEVVVGDLEFLRHRLGRLAAQINPSEEFPITWTQRRKDLVEAAADGGFDLVNRWFCILAGDRQVPEKALIAPRFSAL